MVGFEREGDFREIVSGCLQNDAKRFFTSFRKGNHYLLAAEFD